MNKGCLIGLGIILLLLTGGLIFYFSSQGDGGPEKYDSVQPEIKTILNKAVATGSIKPRLEVNVKPQVSGVVDQLYVEAGQEVKKGDRLARIKLIPSEVNVNSARSNVELARIRVQEAQRELTRQQKINQDQLDIQEAQRSYEQALQEEQRQKQLLKDGITSQQEYDRVKLDLDIKKNTLDNASITSNNDLKAVKAQLDIRQQELAAAVDNLQLLKEGVTKNSRQVSNIVLATVDGMVLDVPVEEGSSVIERNNFNEGTSIAVLADMNNIIFEGKVDESDVGKLSEGMSLKLSIGALPDASLDALLEFISPKGVEEEGTVKFEIKAAIQDRPTEVFLRAGYSANGDVIINKRDSVLSIQERDVIYRNDSTFVEKVVGEDQYEELEVDLGLSDGINIEVLAGLDTTISIKKRIAKSAETLELN